MGHLEPFEAAARGREEASKREDSGVKNAAVVSISS